MLSFIVVAPKDSDRIYIYNQLGIEVAQCSSMNAVFNHFYNQHILTSRFVTYAPTKCKNVILVLIK